MDESLLSNSSEVRSEYAAYGGQSLIVRATTATGTGGFSLSLLITLFEYDTLLR